MTDSEIARLDQKQRDMADDIKEIKDDIKGIKGDIVNLKVSVAKYGVYILVGIAIIEFAVRYFFKI